ncbi:MAG: iron ABC transporter permease [Bacteroides sp.]|nr:iron ABC transporter permease [Bacteroides sp.]MCM1085326.1 iron ABC transporter permease [Bacteroides sp.]
MGKRFFFQLFSASLLLLLCFFFSLSWGESPLFPWQWGGMEKDGLEMAIIRHIRLPRSLTALCIGGMLSMSGCLLQGLFKNPLVEPYTLGISGGASLGVALAVVLGVSPALGFWGIGSFAFAGAIAVSVLILFYGRSRHGIGNLLLAGIMTGILCSSGTTLLMSLSSPQDMTRILYWTMGSLESNDMHRSLILCVFAGAGLAAGVLISQRVNLLSAGSRNARLMGVNTAVLVPALLILTSLLTAVSTAQTGIIGFVGLIVPHILRRLCGNDYRLLVPLSFLGGGIFLLLCDLIARSIIAPSQLPIGVVSGILGGSVFIYLLLRKNKEA